MVAADQPPKRLVIGRRRSRPKARGVIRIPGAAWRRLYSARSTILHHLVDHLGRHPGGDHLLAPQVALDVGLQHPVEQLVGGQRVASNWSGRSSAEGARSITDAGIGSPRGPVAVRTSS